MSKASSRISRTMIAISLAVFTAFWLIGAPRLGTPSSAQGQQPICLTVKTGNGTVGGLDSQIQWTAAAPAPQNFVSATIVPPFILGSFSWDTIPGTQWVSIDSNLGGANFQNQNFTFRTTFTLPASYSSPSISIQVHSDNVATFFLNGNSIGGQSPDVEVVPYFQNPPESATSSNAAFFHPGVNTLTINLHNFTDALGLDFLANICYLPAQGCIDEDPPAVSCNVAETQLWPPNHDLKNVGLTARITDDCDCFGKGDNKGDDDDDDHHGDDDDDNHHGDDDDDNHHGNSVASAPNKGGAGSVGINTGGGHNDDDDDDHHGDDDDCDTPPGGSHGVAVIVYSDEPDLDVPGSGNFSPDAKNIGIGTLRLREERSGNGNGRVYLIVVKATDASGKKGICVKTVTVPHSQSNASKNLVIAQANAAKAYYTANQAPPPGYFQVGIGPVVGPKQ